MRISGPAAALIAGVLLSACGGGDRDVRPGIAATQRYGCGSCHVIPRVPGANGQVGPPLAGVGAQRYLAGELLNTPDNMMRWIQHPREVNDKTAMPDVGVTQQDAHDITAFLLSLR